MGDAALNATSPERQSSTREIEVSVWRGAQAGEYRSYSVPFRDSQTVLDVVSFIQRNIDPTLTYRFACRVGVCGSCAMTVNGIPRWTCRTHVNKVAAGGRLTVAPLANLPVIKDLACDMTPFFEKWQAADGRFHGEKTRQDEVAAIAPASPERREADAGIECINCAVCYSACDVVEWRGDYLGPAALNRAWTLQNDVRDRNFDARLAAVSASGGCQNCHSHQSCTQYCPVGLSPTRSIAGLKALTIRALFGRKVGHP